MRRRTKTIGCLGATPVLLLAAAATVWFIALIWWPSVRGGRGGMPGLHQAAAAGDLQGVERALKWRVPVNLRDASNMTALDHAVVRGRLAVSECLISRGAEVDTALYPNPGALARAAFEGDARMVALLLDSSASVNYLARARTPLQWAVDGGNAEVVRLLLEHGAVIRAADTEGRTAMHSAAATGGTDLAELLLARGADIEAVDKGGNTPLHLAANEGKTEIVTWLLTHGANADARNARGWTPIHLAAASDRSGVVQVLRAHGAASEPQPEHVR